MLGFFKGRDRSIEPVAPGTRVEEVPFTAREIYAILRDVDAPMFICNTTTLDLLRPAAMRPDEWRRRAVARLAPAGIVDEACSPCPELEALLEPLKVRRVIIADGKMPLPGASRDERTFCLAGTRERATLVRSTGDGFSRTFTLSDAGPREKWWTHALRSAGFPRVRCAPPAASVPFIEGDPADAGLPEALMRGDLDSVRAFAVRWGADPDRLAETSAAIARGRDGLRLEMCYLRVIDATEGDVELAPVRGFTMRKLLGGGARTGRRQESFPRTASPSQGGSAAVRACHAAGSPTTSSAAPRPLAPSTGWQTATCSPTSCRTLRFPST